MIKGVYRPPLKPLPKDMSKPKAHYLIMQWKENVLYAKCFCGKWDLQGKRSSRIDVEALAKRAYQAHQGVDDEEL